MCQGDAALQQNLLFASWSWDQLRWFQGKWFVLILNFQKICCRVMK